MLDTFREELLSLGVPQKRITKRHCGYGTTKRLSDHLRTPDLRQTG
jgi:hypothetical protein